MSAVVLGLLHGLGLAALASVIGGLVLERMVIPARLPELAATRSRLHRLITCGLVLLVLTTCAELVFRTQAMGGASLGAAIARLPEIVARTHIGAMLSARACIIALAAVLSLASAPALRALCLLSALGAALTMSLTGHAADWGDVTPSVAIDWIHAVAASAWTGGLFGLVLAVLPRQAAVPTPVLGDIGRRFSRLATVCLVAVLATGVANAWTQLEVLSRLWTTAYGQVLIVKVALVLAVAWLGAMNRYLVLPRLGDARDRRGFGARLFRLVFRGRARNDRGVAAPARLSRYVAREALVAVAVFACTAALGELTPGRHTAFERKRASHVTNVTRNQATSDSPRNSGVVTPPPGDPARGRAVFVRLRCFTCHAVPGERMLAPTRPGPALEGASRLQPGYLVESIMNPNARILDGPGYTDDRGVSIMPDYGEKMTVRELADLVAYLRTLGGGAAPPAENPSPRSGR